VPEQPSDARRVDHEGPRRGPGQLLGQEGLPVGQQPGVVQPGDQGVHGVPVERGGEQHRHRADPLHRHRQHGDVEGVGLVDRDVLPGARPGGHQPPGGLPDQPGQFGHGQRGLPRGGQLKRPVQGDHGVRMPGRGLLEHQADVEPVLVRHGRHLPLTRCPGDTVCPNGMALAIWVRMSQGPAQTRIGGPAAAVSCVVRRSVLFDTERTTGTRPRSGARQFAAPPRGLVAGS
jgi:hypothetical protein